MPSPPSPPRSRRRTALRVAGRGLLLWAIVLGGLRAFVVQAEQCGDPTPEALLRASSDAVDWFARNQRADGRWMYRYDRDADAEVEGYNITRHAGVTMSLEQAATAGIDGAAEVAERGIVWATLNLYEGPGWRALAPADTPQFGSGATGLLTAALVYRRDRTADETYDELMHDLGAFMASMVTERGQVHATWDDATQAPVPDTWSKYYTGEVFWALAMLHHEFPDAGYGEPAARIARYIATERREAENFQPDLPDHWAAYGFAAMTTWPGWEMPDEYLPYARRQAGLMSVQIRYESQRTNSLISHLTRGRQTLGAGLGTIGEALAQWSIVATATPALDDILDPLAERTRCVAGAAIDRQVGDDDIAADDDPSAVHGAWFQFDITQMDDQQHVLSALLGAMALPRGDE